MKAYNTFRAAAVQAAPVYINKPNYFDSQATLEKALGLIAEASENGATLIVFPETFLPGYPYWSINLAQGPEWAGTWAEFLRHSIEVPGRETDALCQAAKRSNAYVVMGINERDAKYEGRMYNSILFISPQGEVLGTHRKVCITVQELFFHTRGDGGANLRVHDANFGKLSGLICGEHYHPLLRYNLIVQGSHVHCLLWPGYKGGAEELTTTIPVMTQSLAASGGLWAVASCTYIPPDQIPTDFYDNHAFDQTFGGSCIVNPFGQIVAGPETDKETIVYGDIDLKLNAAAKSIINLNGIYSRWDILNLGVREKFYQPVWPMDELGGASLPDMRASEVEELRREIALLEADVRRLRGENEAR